MNEYKIGVLVGVLIGCLLITVFIRIILKKIRTNGRIRCEYDERQELSRGKGFKYGFFTLLIMNMLLAFYNEIAVQPITDIYNMQIMTSCIGILVYVIYCIWHDCYFALNERRKTLLIIFVFAGISNFALGISHVEEYFHGKAAADGMMNGTGNIMIGFMFLVIFAVLLLKELKDRKENEE